jgi:hypothetical protein
MKEHEGTGGMAALILNVGTIGSSVVSFTFRPFYHWEIRLASIEYEVG